MWETILVNADGEMAWDAFRDVFQGITSDRGRGILWVIVLNILQSTSLGKNYACACLGVFEQKG